MHSMDMQSAVIARLPVPDEPETFKVVRNLVTSALLECCSVDEFEAFKETSVIQCVTEQAHADLQAFALKDPAAGRDLVFIARTYTSYSAVLHYRLAHWIYNNTAAAYGAGGQCLAAMISRRGKMLSGAEIHFRSRIGARFIIDHGMGTVIGETSTIGDDCYVLGGVTLGAAVSAATLQAPGTRPWATGYKSARSPVCWALSTSVTAHLSVRAALLPKMFPRLPGYRLKHHCRWYWNHERSEL